MSETQVVRATPKLPGSFPFGIFAVGHTVPLIWSLAVVIAHGKVNGWDELGIGIFTLYVLYPPYLLTVIWFSIACLVRRSANRWYWGLVGLLFWDVAVYLLYHFVLPHPTEPMC